MTSAVRVRAIVEPGDDARFEKLRDPFGRAILLAEPLASERVTTRWGDDAALRRLAEAKRRPLEPSLAAAMRDEHVRLGASAASLANLERLARGEAVAAIAGQQPAPLGGPLYALHKTAATVGLARRVTARTGVPCVPMFWTHAEDSDFAEIRGVTVADRTLGLHDLALDDRAHKENGLVGAIEVAPVAALGELALARWEGLPEEAAAAAAWRAAVARARDLGELQSALALAWFADAGLVVVDPRRDAFRAAARPVVDRYLAAPDGFSAQARAAGEWLERHTGRRPLADAALESFVFEIEDGARHKIAAREALARGAGVVLSPSVALRPVVQDAVLPTVAMACGPGELAYLAQLREVFEGLQVQAAAPVPRFGATWLPPAAVALAEASGADAWDVVCATDAVVRAVGEARVPAPLRRALDEARERASAGLGAVAEASRALDASLPQMIESARGKVDFQYARLAEGFASKARHQLERERPEWARLRYYLWPGDRLQERRLASLEPLAYRGAAVGASLAELAEEHAARLEAGHATHVLLEL